MAGEQVFELEPLAVGAGVDAPAIQLLLERVRRFRPAFLPTADDLAALVDVAGLLDGIPLALELAASRLRLLSTRQLLRRLRESFALLSPDMADGRRHATMRATLNWSWQALSPAEQAALAALSVCRGGATIEAMEAVVDAGPDRSPLDLIAALQDKSLVHPRRMLNESEPRLFLYEMVRHFAAENLAASGQEAAARARHSRWYADLAARCRELPHQHVGQVQAELASEVDNLATALESLTSAPPQAAGCDAVALASGLAHVLLRTGPVSALEPRVDTALRLADLGGVEPGDMARMLLIRAWTRRISGRACDAIADGLRALATARAAGSQACTAFAHAELGALMLDSGQMPEAVSHLQAAMAILRATGDRHGQALVASRLSWVSVSAGDLDAAEAHAREAADLARGVGDLLTEGLARLGLASVAQERGHIEAAIDLTLSARTLFERAGDVRRLAIVHFTLSMALEESRDLPGAIAAGQSAVDALETLGDQLAGGVAATVLAGQLAQVGRIDEAEALQLRAEAQLAGQSDVLRTFARVRRGHLCLARSAQAGDAGQTATAAALHADASEILSSHGPEGPNAAHLAVSDDLRWAIRQLRRAFDEAG